MEISIYFPKIGSPNLLAALLEAKSTAAAPSVICELFPAVLHPFGLKAGRSFCKVYKVVGLGPSSLVQTIFLPSDSNSQGTIYSVNLPSFCAFNAFVKDSKAN